MSYASLIFYSEINGRGIRRSLREEDKVKKRSNVPIPGGNPTQKYTSKALSRVTVTA
jgi:hypothetical protein